MKLNNIKVLLVWITFGLILFGGAQILLDNQIAHSTPHGLYAMDATTHTVFAEAFYQEGNAKFYPSYSVMGYEDVVAANPPVVYSLAASFAYLSGLSIYDSLVFLELLMFVLIPIVMYLFIRKFNETVAILSLPLSILLIKNPFFSALSWGEYPFILGILLMVTGIWAIPNINLKYFAVPFALLLSALFMAHASEFMVLVAFIFVFYVVQIYFRKQIKKTTISLSLTAMLIISICFHYYVIFKNTFVKLQLSTSFEPIYNAGYLVPEFIKDFPIIVWLILLVGVILSILYCYTHLKNKNKRWIYPALALFLLVITYTNLIGQKRALQIRLLWPALLMFFFGLVLYFIFTKTKQHKNWWLSFAVVLVLLVGFFGLYHSPFAGPGLIDPYTWEGFQWMKENTPQESTIIFFYGDTYNQHTMLNLANRQTFLIDPNSLIENINNQKISYSYKISPEVFLDTWLAYKKSFFEFGYYYTEGDSKYQPFVGEVCDFDYLVFNKFSRNQPLADYNVAVANTLLQNGKSRKSFENALIIIIEINGGDCFETN
jgi:hypothetical protein